jgi:hypothetical protein
MVPIDLEVLGIKAGSLACLPVIIETRGPEQIHAVVLLTLDERFGVQKAGVHDLGPTGRG